MDADTLLVGLLLALPPGVPEPHPGERFEALAKAGQTVALSQGWMDERETRYTLTRPDDWQADLDTIRRRREELADAPPLSDVHRLPPRDDLIAAIEFNRRFRRRVWERADLELDRSEALREVVAEADLIYAVYDAARDARCEFYYSTVRRQALKRLRNLLGDAAYNRCELPPCVPLWRFNELRP